MIIRLNFWVYSLHFNMAASRSNTFHFKLGDTLRRSIRSAWARSSGSWCLWFANVNTAHVLFCRWLSLARRRANPWKYRWYSARFETNFSRDSSSALLFWNVWNIPFLIRLFLSLFLLLAWWHVSISFLTCFRWEIECAKLLTRLPLDNLFWCNLERSNTLVSLKYCILNGNCL